MEQAVKCDQYSGKVPMAVWAKTYPFIKDACGYSDGEYTPAHILRGIEEGRFQLWVVSKAGEIVWVWTTSILDRAGTSLAFIFCAGGSDLETGLKFWSLMSIWMKRLGLDRVECQCRPGIARLLKQKLPNLKTKYEVLTIEPEEL